MKFFVTCVNMPDGTENNMDIVKEFPNADAMCLWADQTYPGWSSIAVTVISQVSS